MREERPGSGRGSVAGTSAAPAPAARGRPRDSDVDRRIHAATFRQLVELGYGALSVESVAAEAGVAKTTIYRRYSTKADLVSSVLTVEVPFELPPEELGGREALDRFVRLVIRMLIESGAIRIFGSLLAEEVREPGLLDVFRARIIWPRLAGVEGMLRRGIERGELRPDIDPLVVMEMIAGAIFGHHAILGRVGNEAWIASLVDHLWAAIAVDRGERGPR